jgi:hypothetical protein
LAHYQNIINICTKTEHKEKSAYLKIYKEVVADLAKIVKLFSDQNIFQTVVQVKELAGATPEQLIELARGMN